MLAIDEGLCHSEQIMTHVKCGFKEHLVIVTVVVECCRIQFYPPMKVNMNFFQVPQSSIQMTAVSSRC